jgi:hypothetical protein
MVVFVKLNGRHNRLLKKKYGFKEGSDEEMVDTMGDLDTHFSSLIYQLDLPYKQNRLYVTIGM